MTTVAIVGGGQLGQMLGEAGAAIGVECRFLDPSANPPASSAGTVVRADYDDANGLEQLVRDADVLTYEFENVPVAGVRPLESRLPVYPPPLALEKSQDRLREKQLFDTLGIPTSPFRNVESPADVQGAAEELGLPLVFKTRRFGYDGKGQAIARDAADIDALWQSLGEVPLIAERFVDFDCEVSIIGARSPGGEIVTWPLSENRHAGGILRVSRAPYDDAGLHGLACDYHRRMLEALDYVGVLTLEMFVSGGSLVANEFAPRVHNSGHWTIEGSETSQFENHLRAVLDRPLGPTGMTGPAAMVNIIGTMPHDVHDLAGDGVYFHDYGKSPRDGRKLAHFTVVSDTVASRERTLDRLLAALATD